MMLGLADAGASAPINRVDARVQAPADRVFRNVRRERALVIVLASLVSAYLILQDFPDRLAPTAVAGAFGDSTMSEACEEGRIARADCTVTSVQVKTRRRAEFLGHTLSNYFPYGFLIVFGITSTGADSTEPRGV